MRMIYKFFGLLFFLGFLPATSQEVQKIQLKNPLNSIRKDEPIILLRDSLLKNSVDNFVIKDENGVLIPFQLDDTDVDGKWDEIAIVIDFKESEIKTIALEVVANNRIPEFTKRTQVYLGVSRDRNDKFTPVKEETRPKDHVAQSTPFLYQFEGPGWENDKVAFRSYFDCRNGKDVFGKLTSKMVLDSVGLPGKSYHEPDYWGMDVLKVGKSLGAGALAAMYKDSLYRLGATENAHFRIIANGPVRAIFELRYEGWNINGNNYDVIERITIWAGKYYYSSKIVLKGNHSQNVKVVAGVTTLHAANPQPDFAKTDQYSMLLVNDIVSENKDYLSLGILISNKSFEKWTLAPQNGNGDQITNTVCLIFNSDECEFHFFAGWEKSDIRFKTENLLQKIMLEEAEKLGHSIIIK